MYVKLICVNTEFQFLTALNAVSSSFFYFISG